MKSTEYNSLAASKTAARKAHFASGATPAMWRPRSVVLTKAKHNADKMADRNNREF